MNINKEIRLIISDIEGCLSLGKGKTLDLSTLAKIQYYNMNAKKCQGIPLTLCTGRPQPFVEAFCQILSVYCPCVCENGAFLYDIANDTFIRHPSITDSHIKAVKELTRFFEAEVRPKLPHRREPGKEICISLNPEVSLNSYSKQVQELYERIIPYVDPALFNITYSASAVDITPCGIDKAAGVTFLSDVMQIPLEQMLGIGDTLGDLPFLRIVGIATAPNNMSEALRGSIHYTSVEPEARGVLEIISLLENRVISQSD